jgi:hypothetical protein
VNAGPYRDSQVHVLGERCPSCIFRPGNRMHLEPGRVRSMVDAAVRDGGGITCHDTLYREDVDQAVCRGFWDAHRDRVQALQVAERLRVVVWDPVPPDRLGKSSPA